MDSFKGSEIQRQTGSGARAASLFVLFQLLLGLSPSAQAQTGAPPVSQQRAARPPGVPVYENSRRQQRQSDRLNRRGDQSYSRAQVLQDTLLQKRASCSAITVNSGNDSERRARLNERVQCIRRLRRVADELLQREIQFINDNAAAATYRLRHLNQEAQYRAQPNETPAQRSNREAQVRQAAASLQFLQDERPRGIQGLRRTHQFFVQEIASELQCIQPPRGRNAGVWRDGDWMRETPGMCIE
jgi:hypothetical protein